jgi:hypothetical protein
MKHLFSDSGDWLVYAEFIDPFGKVMLSTGKADISVDENGIVNDTLVSSRKINRRNGYRIIPAACGEMITESIDPDQPFLTGLLDIARNNIRFKFRMDGSDVNGYETILRKRDVCYAYGELYDGATLLQRWSLMMNRRFKRKFF